MDLFLKRTIVKILYKNNLKGVYPNRYEFATILYKNHWLNFNYMFLDKSDRSHHFWYVAGDCIEGKEKYIAYDDDRTSLIVTTEGRKLIETFPWIGFIDILLDGYPKIVHFGLAFISSGFILLIIQLILKYRFHISL